MALLIAVLFASWSLGTRCGLLARRRSSSSPRSASPAMGMTLLIVGGGGGFARVLRDAGVADAIGRGGEALHLPPLLYGWLLSAFIRVATGSATVAITTASALLVPVLAQHPELTPAPDRADHRRHRLRLAVPVAPQRLRLLDREGLPGSQRGADAAHLDGVRDDRRHRRHAAVAGRVPADLAGLTAAAPQKLPVSPSPAHCGPAAGVRRKRAAGARRWRPVQRVDADDGVVVRPHWIRPAVTDAEAGAQADAARVPPPRGHVPAIAAPATNEITWSSSAREEHDPAHHAAPRPPANNPIPSLLFWRFPGAT